MQKDVKFNEIPLRVPNLKSIEGKVKALIAELKEAKDYASFVYYWIAFKGTAYGLHHATWRSSFGGKIYKTNGSHGCINMPYYNAQQLYSMVTIGTPVYIY